MLRFDRYAVTFCACALAVIPVAAQQRAPDLDLTILDRPIEASDPNEGTVTVTVIGYGWAEGIRVEPLLQVRLLGLNPVECAAGEPLTFDVELRNVSRTDLLVPWSVDSRDVGTATAGFFPALSLALWFEEGKRRGVIDALDTLFGNTFGMFTTRRLGRGEAVVLRVGGKCAELGDRDHDFRRGTHVLRVTAHVGLKSGIDRVGSSVTYRLGPSITSGNSMPLTITWPEPPQ